jgi:hypothetical protein
MTDLTDLSASRPDPDTLAKIRDLGRENLSLLLIDILQSEPNPENTSPIPLNLVQITPSISYKKLIQRLADRIRHAYISLQDLTEELQEEGHEQLADTLRELKFAKVPALRSGELAEIIATDLMRSAGYIVPLERLRFKEDNDRAVPNCDTIGFYFDVNNPRQDVLCVGEAKSQATRGKKDTNIYKNGMQSLKTRNQMKRDKAVQFVYEKLRKIAGAEVARCFKRFRSTFTEESFQLKARAIGLQDFKFWAADLMYDLEMPADYIQTEIDAVLIKNCNRLIRDAFERAIEDMRCGRVNSDSIGLS